MKFSLNYVILCFCLRLVNILMLENSLNSLEENLSLEWNSLLNFPVSPCWSFSSCVSSPSCFVPQRVWRSTSASTARWRSVWWCEIRLLSARGEGTASPASRAAVESLSDLCDSSLLITYHYMSTSVSVSLILPLLPPSSSSPSLMSAEGLDSSPLLIRQAWIKFWPKPGTSWTPKQWVLCIYFPPPANPIAQCLISGFSNNPLLHFSVFTEVSTMLMFFLALCRAPHLRCVHCDMFESAVDTWRHTENVFPLQPTQCRPVSISIETRRGSRVALTADLWFSSLGKKRSRTCPASLFPPWGETEPRKFLRCERSNKATTSCWFQGELNCQLSEFFLKIYQFPVVWCHWWMCARLGTMWSP